MLVFLSSESQTPPKPRAWAINNMWSAGDWVVAESSATGTMSVNLPGAKTKGKSYSGNYLEFYQFADGKVKQHWVFENSLAFAIQVGLVDPAKMAPPAK